MDANELAKRVAHSMLAAEGTGPAWGLKIEEVREDYARVSMVVRADLGRPCHPPMRELLSLSSMILEYGKSHRE